MKSQYPRPKVVRKTYAVVTRETSTNVVIQDALSILSDQINLLRIKSGHGATLEDQDIKNLRTFVQSLVELRKDERAQEVHDNVSGELKDMSMEELLALYKGEDAPKQVEAAEPKKATEEP